MKLQDQIDRLNADLADLHHEQDRCRHDWGKPVTETRTRSEPYGFKTVAQGSDIWTEPEGYHDVPYTVWVRTCVHCGKRQETEKSETVAVKTETRAIFP